MAFCVRQFFFTRERLNKWPNKTLEKIRNAGCLVVPVGHPSSVSRDIEWRWSFSVAEKELLQDMNGSLPTCLFTLKALKGMYISSEEESDEPTPFCSYFLKTACLWLYESIPHEDYNIMDLIRKLLSWLIECYQKENLPHYFIPSQNLIGHLPKKVCEEVQEKLKRVNGPSLWKMVMSCIGNSPYEREIFNSMCDKLGIAKVGEGDSHQQLETNLLSHPRAKEELENVIRKLSPGDYIHDKFQYLNIVKWLSLEFPSLIRELHILIEFKAETSKILDLPESVIMPIIHMLDDLVPDGYKLMFQQHLLRYLGDVYTYLLIYLRNKYGAVAGSDLHRYKDKPIQYYELGAEMVFPDKWSDRTQGGIILLAKYYYLTGDHETLNKILKTIGPQMPFINQETMNRHINIEIKNTLHLSLSSWAADKKLQKLAIVFGPTFHLHPVVFVFYMQARVALSEDDVKKASAHLNSMKECLIKILDLRLRENTMPVIKIIENEIINRGLVGLHIDR
ncbi:uncharacterized protein LOC117118228 [Anneissia japonica]|uniref:uncharacterized protein LOC117118228 n=1 Tax=Anneissia japonica TaxID=1529436 RepID=UPI0014259ED9|nr:uncharacterized protein LOC117118228 [Anneissia japonica]